MARANPGIDRSRIGTDYAKLGDQLAAVYAAVEEDLIREIARQLKPNGRIKEDWYARKLAQMGNLSKSVVERIAAYRGLVSNEVKAAVRTAVTDAIAATDPVLAANIKRGYVPPKDALIQRCEDAYAGQALNACNMVNTTMLNSTLNAYGQIVNEVGMVEMRNRAAYTQQELNAEAGAVIYGTKTARQALSDALVNIAQNGLPAFIDKAGRQWDGETYIRMDIRTTTANAAREAVMRRNEDYGNSLISVSAHAGSRPLCYPYQGQVYSTNGWSGDVTDLHGTTYHVVPLSSTSYGQPAGLFGINCGHMSYPFFVGKSVIRADVQDKALNDKWYALNREQSDLERAVRRARRCETALKESGDLEGAAKWKEKRQAADARLKGFIDDANGAMTDAERDAGMTRVYNRSHVR